MNLQPATISSDVALKRWCVVVLMIGAMSGGYMLLYALSPLQILLQTDAGWNLGAYSRYSSAEQFLNVFCFVLPVSGLLIDRLGTRYGGLLSGILMLLGGTVNYYALTEAFKTSALAVCLDDWFNLPDTVWNITPFSAGMPASAKLSAIGFMLFGVGMEMAGVAASKGTVSWFRGKELAVALGLQLAGSRGFVALSLWLSPQLAMEDGVISIARPLGWMLLFLAAGVCCWIAFGILDRGNKHRRGKETEPIWGPMRSLCRPTARNRLLWLLALICVAYYASVIPFFRYATAMFQSSLGIQAEGAASLIALLPMASALATPLVCLIPDYKGGAIPLMLGGAACIIVCFISFAFLLPVFHSAWIAYAGIGLLGLSSAMVSAGLWPLMPRLAPDKILGSAYAGFYWLQAIGLYLTPLLVATVVSDSKESDAFAYTPAMLLFAALAMVAFLGAAWLGAINYRAKLGLNLPNKVNNNN